MSNAIQRPVRVALIGFMGSGKSTIGQLLAERLNVPLIDTDAVIVQQTGFRTVGDAFVTLGESAFRSLESSILADVTTSTEAILSPGGGVVMVPDNRALLAGWRVICLYAPFATIVDRLVLTEREARPLLKERERAIALYEQRLPIYRGWATDEIDTTGRFPSELADEILHRIL